MEQDDVEVCVEVLTGNLAPGIILELEVQTMDGSAFGMSNIGQHQKKLTFLLTTSSFLNAGARDYEILMDNGTLSEGNPQACYDIVIEDDNVIELQELFYVSLTSLPGPIENLVTINPNVSSVLIIDNDGT